MPKTNTILMQHLHPHPSTLSFLTPGLMPIQALPLKCYHLPSLQNFKMYFACFGEKIAYQ